MSLEIQNAVWQESKSSGRARLVLLSIADHQGQFGAWPSIATIAKLVNASERSVQRDIQELEKSGELIVRYRKAPTRGTYKANLYWVNLPSVAHHISEVTDCVSEVSKDASEVTKSASEVTAGGVLTIKEPLKEPSKEWVEFWELYPKAKKDDDEFPAMKRFERLSKADKKAALEGLHRYLASSLPENQFIPKAKTWLADHRWLNDYTPKKSGWNF